MSTIHQQICDQCNKVHEKKTGEDCTPYDPDEFWGWLFVRGTTDVWDMDGDSRLDFCSVKCLSAWAQVKEKEWIRCGMS